MMKLRVSPVWRKCWLFHRWREVKNTGETIYRECKDCKTREVIQQDGVYEPIDWNWLNGNTDKIE